ncbi:hypothetical protein HDU82_001523 [Entophlyctis luteolus]|nr:hypothetical protein HDU82_001523 [Entophlyctis luteolus]
MHAARAPVSNTPKTLQSSNTRKYPAVSSSRVPVPVRHHYQKYAAVHAEPDSVAHPRIPSGKVRVSSATIAPSIAKPSSASSTYTKPIAASRTDSGLFKTSLDRKANQIRTDKSSANNSKITSSTITEKNASFRDATHSDGLRLSRVDAPKVAAKQAVPSPHAKSGKILFQSRRQSDKLKAENEKLHKANF